MASKDAIINIDTYNSNNIASSSGGSIITSHYNENKWREEMEGMLNKQHDTDVLHHPVCIFQVPKSLIISNPEAYTPQTIALGPHHHFLPKLYYKMQKCKLHQVQVLHQLLNFPAHKLFFDQIKAKVRDIRGYYLEHLDIHDDTFSWIMVIDAFFLLQLIYQEAAPDENANSLEFADSLGREIPMDAVLKDVVMIENQIPFVVLEDLNSLLVQSQFPPTEGQLVAGAGSLTDKSIKLCKRISPIELQGSLLFNAEKSLDPFHLLDLLYNLVWFGDQPPDPSHYRPSRPRNARRIDPWNQLLDTFKALNIGALNIPMKIIELAFDVFNVLGISFSFQDQEEKNLIPAASQLSGVRVNFCKTSKGIRGIHFKRKQGAADLCLPVLQLNANSEVVIRNLLAYETIARPRPPNLPNFARYIEMMAAMIHNVKDVKLLKDKNILKHGGDHSEVVKLFNRIKSSIQSEGESSFDSCIKNLNNHYDNHWKIKLKRQIMKYLCSSWRILTILAVILLLVLMALQTFCSIYSCHGAFKTVSN